MTDSSVFIDRTVGSITSSLLSKIRADDQQAWERLVDVYGPLVYWWCKGRGLSASDAADVGQEVFLAVSKNLETFQRNTPQDSFRGWLRTITENKIRDYYRRTAAEPVSVGGSVGQAELAQLPVPPALEESAEEVGILARQIVQLVRGEFSEQDWQAFSRSVFENQVAADVAEQLGITTNQVYLAKSRILRRLRDEFGEAFDGMFGP